MATEVVQVKWDDLHLKEDGPDRKVPGDHVRTFRFQGEDFEIDLSEEHADEFDNYMTRLADAGRIQRKPKTARPRNGRVARGRASPFAKYRAGLREYFEAQGRPVKHYNKSGTDKPAGYKYKREHYDEYNEHLRAEGRAAEVMEYHK